MATVPAGNGTLEASEGVEPPPGLATSDAPRPGATLTEGGVEPPKRKTTSFKITNVFQSRPPSNDPDDIWEDGDDVDDSRTEDLSDIADSLTSLSSQLDPLVQAEGGQAVSDQPQPGQVNSTAPSAGVAPAQVAPSTVQAAPTTGQIAPTTGQVAPPASQVAPSTSQVTLPPGQVSPATGQVATSAGQVAPPPNQVAPPSGQVVPPTGPGAPSTGQVAPSTGQVAPSSGQVAPPAGQVAQPSGHIAPTQGQTSQPLVQGVPAPVQSAPPSGQSAPPSGPSAPSSGQQRGQIVTVGPGQNGATASVLGPSQVVMPQILPPVLQHQVSCPPQGLAPVPDSGRRPSHDPKLAGEARRLSSTTDENNQERAFQQGQAPYHLPGFGFVTFQPEGLPVTYVDYSGHLITAMVPATGNNADKAGVSEDNQVLPVHGPLDIRSRFKIVKIETTEPIKRGRWTCFDFLDKQTDQKLVTTAEKGSVPSSTDAKKTVSTVGPKSVVPSSLTKASAVASSSTKVVVTQAGKVPLVPSSVSKPAVTLSSANASLVNSATVSAVNTPDAMPSSVLTRGQTTARSDVAEVVGRFKVASSEPPTAARGTASGPGSVEREIVEGAKAATDGSRIQRISGSRPPDPLRVSEPVYPAQASYPSGQGSMNGPNYINISPQAGSPYATINQPVIQSPVAVQGRPDFSGQQASGIMPGSGQQQQQPSGQQQQPSGHLPSSGGQQQPSGQQPSGQQMSSSSQQPNGHIQQQHPSGGHSSQASSNQQQFTGQPSQQSSPQSTVTGKTSQQVATGQYIVQDKSGLQYIVQQGQQPASHPSQQTSSHPTSQQQPTSNHPSQGHPVQQASSHPVQPAGSHPSQQQQQAQVIPGQVLHVGGSSQVAATVGHTQGSTSGHPTMTASGRQLGQSTVSGASLPVSGGGSVTGSGVPTTVSATSGGHPQQQFQPQQLVQQQLIQQVSHSQQLPTHPSHVQQVPNQTQVSSQNQQVQTQSVSQTQQVIKPTAPQQQQQPPSIPPSTTQKKHSSSSQQGSSSQPPPPSSLASDMVPGTSSTPPLHNPPAATQAQKVGVGSGHVVLAGQQPGGAAQRTTTQNLVYGATPGYLYTPQYQQQGYSRSISHQPSTEVYNHHPGVEGEILAERLEEIVKEEQAVEDGLGLVQRPEEETESGSGAGQASIDNRIEQAMDLVKSHLMNAVRSEVEELKDKINKLEDTISHLSRENEILRARASPETLQMVTGGGTSQPPDPAKPPVQQH